MSKITKDLEYHRMKIQKFAQKLAADFLDSDFSDYEIMGILTMVTLAMYSGREEAVKTMKLSIG